MSKILMNWLAGKGFPDELVIDGHIHVGEWPHAATSTSVDEAARLAVEHLDANGVDAFWALGGGYMWPGADDRLGNDFLLALWKRLPERMIPFTCPNPVNTREHVLRELRRTYDAGVRGIKLLHPYQGGYPDEGPNLMCVYEFAAERNMPVISHGWGEPALRRLAARFPTVDFIFAHFGGGGWPDDVLREFPNVHANIWGYSRAGFLDRAIREVGAHKFMLGSDGFLNCLSVGLGPVAFLDGSDAEKRLILGVNAARIIEKAGALPARLRSKLRLHDPARARARAHI